MATRRRVLLSCSLRPGGGGTQSHCTCWIPLQALRMALRCPAEVLPAMALRGMAGSQSHGSGPAPRRAHAAAGGEDARPGKGGSQRRGTSHTTRHRRDSQTEASPPPTPTAGEGRRQGHTDAPATSPGAGSPPSTGWCHHRGRSPLPVQGACSLLRLLCRPGAGGHRPAGSSVMQGGAQPPAGQREGGGAPETVLLVGMRGTGRERGSAGGGRHREGRCPGGRRGGPGPSGLIQPPPLRVGQRSPPDLSVSQILMPPHNSCYSQSEPLFP